MKKPVLALILSLMVMAGATPALADKACADVNKDLSVDAVDATIILQVVADLYDPGLIILPLWDPSGNDQIDSTDATIVLQHVAGLLDEAPTCF